MSSQTQDHENENPFAPRDPNIPTKIYTGRCHCGKFEFECRHPILEDGYWVASCNCSICTQRGYLMIYILDPKEEFKSIKGSPSELTPYQFNKRFVTHKFCPVCGSGLFGSITLGEREVVAVNVRALVDVDLEKLNLRKFDGRNKL